MGCAGHPLVKTPHLDALAARGTRFSNAYTPSPICVPARASFATGKYVHETRLWDNAMPYTGQPESWGHALQSKGVNVESIGKLHYRDPEDPVGFDTEHIPMMVADGVGMVWASLRREAERVAAPKRMLGEYIGPGNSTYTDYDTAVTDRAVTWLKDRENESQPWCLYVGLVAPHFPLVVPQEFFDLYPCDALPAVKLNPKDGYKRHSWVEKQNAFMDSETKFRDPDERLAAMAAYFGLCTWLDHNIGQIITTLEETGLSNTTNVIYSSDHGDNVGARGLWGKSTLYEESTAIPMIASGPDWAPGICETPVSLLDLSAEVADAFDAPLKVSQGIRRLSHIAREPTDTDRPVFSEYHAAGAVSGAFMLRIGKWKYHHYVGFAPELFNLEQDPEELHDLATDPEFERQVERMQAALRKIVDPEEADAQAFSDQDALIAFHGGRERAITLGAPGATPPPGAAS